MVDETKLIAFNGKMLGDQSHIEGKAMRRATIAGLAVILALGGTTQKSHAQDPSARCVWVGNEQMTTASARGLGLDIEDFNDVEATAFLKAFNAMPPKSHFVATRIFAAVGDDLAYVFFESGNDLCVTPSPLPRERYDALVNRARGNGA